MRDQRLILLFFLVLTAVACSSPATKSRRQMLTGIWYANHLENPGMDSFFKNTQAYIDTIGRNGNDDVNRQVYGATDMDSVRKAMQAQYDSAKNMQQAAVKNTVFSFLADSLAILAFSGNVDSSYWSLDNSDQLILTERHPTDSTPQQISMQIISVSEHELKLRFYEDGAYSTVTFDHKKE
jgi:hypothetical protein